MDIKTLKREKFIEIRKLKEEADYHRQKFSETNDMTELFQSIYLYTKAREMLLDFLQKITEG